MVPPMTDGQGKFVWTLQSCSNVQIFESTFSLLVAVDMLSLNRVSCRGLYIIVYMFNSIDCYRGRHIFGGRKKGCQRNLVFNILKVITEG